MSSYEEYAEAYADGLYSQSKKITKEEKKQLLTKEFFPGKHCVYCKKVKILSMRLSKIR
jgi:hypothetical protein